MEKIKEAQQDWSIIKCKNCGETHKRFRSGMYGNAKDQRWVDENGSQFSGKTCPQCHRENCAKRKRENSKIKALTNG